MSHFRKNLVVQAFKILDKDGSGVVNIDDIKGIMEYTYNVRGL